MRRLAGWAAILSAAGVLTAIAILIYLGVIFGERGLNADATGTAGYTTTLETALLIGSFIAVPVFLVLGATSFVTWLLRKRASRHPASAPTLPTTSLS